VSIILREDDMSFYGKKHIGIFVLFILFLSTVFTGCNGEKKSEFYDNSGNSINGGIAVGNGKVTVYTDGKSLFEIENDTVNELYTIDGSIHGMLNVYDTYIYFYGGIEKNDGTLRKDEGNGNLLHSGRDGIVHSNILFYLCIRKRCRNGIAKQAH
jgi:hypothetical protein